MPASAREHEEAIRRHQAECKGLDERIHAMYVDKLDGLVDAVFFERMSNQWREEQNHRLRVAARGGFRQTEIWLGDKDSNLDWRSQSPLSYR